MSQAISPSVNRVYGLTRVLRAWEIPRSTYYWVRHFQTIEELRQALQDFKERHNQKWLVGRLGYRTPSQVRCESQQTAAQAA